MPPPSDDMPIPHALPPAIAERSRRLNDAPVAPSRPYVLCWLHHAVRDHENPVLDAAIAIGNAIDRPVLVYQGLGGRHRFNADRHHVFIMEGARDLQRGLADRGVAYAFHLPIDPDDASPLGRLLASAAAFVTEDFPAPPFPAWTERWAAEATTAAIAVDGACLLPLRRLPRRFTRAFAFRDAARAEWDARLREPWIDLEPTVEPLDPGRVRLGFTPVDLAAADLAALTAACDIDHAVPPVARIRGGSRAGYTRWEAFRDRGLRRYAARRNDAVDMDAVSGLSPYLHHGHVSPFRIAREADRVGGPGGEKFLDELLVWRELAFNFCATTPTKRLESLEALPTWAQETLAEHAGDERETLHAWETLARGATGDPLWDTAQRSLVRNGELHNNVRMTWGKMIPGWSPSPREALRRLIDLNHRFALDGSDPCSYGGLLWCLGQFDRPFPPGRPVLGTVRERSTATHAARLDAARYASAVDERTGAEPLRVGVVGAGVAGLACARVLSDHGCDVVVLDRGRGPGGRLSTRRATTDDGRTVSFDHGAPFFTVTDHRFARFVRSWIEDGVCAAWAPPRVSWRDGRLEPMTGPPLVVGRPGMNAVCRHLASGLDVRYETDVATLRRTEDVWTIVPGDGDDSHLGPFDAVVTATAATQARRLVAAHSRAFDDVLGAVVEHPTWVLMLELEGAGHDVPPLIEETDHPVVARLVREDAKPGRTTTGDRPRWIVSAREAWAAERLDDPRDEIRAALLLASLELLSAITGRTIAASCVRHAAAHRWSLAWADGFPHAWCLIEPAQRLAVGGDAFGGPPGCHGVEAAFLSGTAAATRLLSLRRRREAADPALAEAPLFAPRDP